MDIVEEYLKNLKRMEDAERYFDSLSDEEYDNLENTKMYKVYLQIVDNCVKLYPHAKELGCDKLYFYERKRRMTRKSDLINAISKCIENKKNLIVKYNSDEIKEVKFFSNELYMLRSMLSYYNDDLEIGTRKILDYKIV